MSNFNSQCGEDKFLAETVFLGKVRGMFVEVGGGFDGVFFSNTKYFEDLGWAGYVYEPVPSSVEKIKHNRKCIVEPIAVVGDDSNQIELYHHVSNPDLSRKEPHNSHDYTKIVVPATPLYDVLVTACEEDDSPADLLSLDTEGTESDILVKYFKEDRGLIYAPTVIIVEHDTIHLPSAKAGLKHLFSTTPYVLIHETEFNLIYRK